MRTRTRLPLVAFALAALAAVPARARGQGAWAAFAPDGEGFAVLTPAAPTAGEQRQLRAGELKAAGRRYEARGDDGATYLVLSLRDADGAGERLVDDGMTSRPLRASPHLDAIAELAWEALIRPEAKRLHNPWAANPSMYFRREFEMNGVPAREYFVKFPKASGPVYVAADGPRIYVVAALGPEAQSEARRRFVDSFALGAGTPAVRAGAKADPADATGVGPGPGRGANEVGGRDGGGVGGAAGPGDGAVDYSRTFRPSELTRRAQVISRPEPSYTESARKFNVTGTVSIRLVLGASGKVERVMTISGLPHGLTRMAVEAARRIRFVPATKDGRPVSQYATIQYNFSIY